MAKELTDLDRAIVMQVVLDRWNPHRLTSKIANHFGLSTNQVRNLRRKPAFQAELAKQTAIYKGEFSGVQLADRKERLIALDQLYRKIPDARVSLRLKVLAAIRHEDASAQLVALGLDALVLGRDPHVDRCSECHGFPLFVYKPLPLY